MVLLILILLAVGLIVSTVSATTMLKNNLLNELDRQLVATADAAGRAGDISHGGFLGSGGTLPSNYFFLLRDANNRTIGAEYRSATLSTWGRPDVPDLTAEQAHNSAGTPMTVPGVTAVPRRSAAAPSDWRVAVYPLTGARGNYGGSLTVALPLATITDTTDQLRKVLSITSVIILALAGLAGYLGVRRTLRPLHTIEGTAKAIAAGNLSQRIPDMPSSTEVGSLAASLNVMLSRIEESFDARTRSEARIRQFVSDASHELRTPLVTIRGYSELFRMGGISTPEEVAQSMQRIEGSALQMTNLVESLLALARLDEASPMRTEPIDLNEFAHHTLSDLNAIDPTRPTAVVPLNDDSEPGVVVVGDPALLRQVLTNLVGNIADHPPAGTAVEIAIGRSDPTGDAPEGVTVEVRDHGPGIPPDHHQQVFNRFHRVDPSRGSVSGGSGLGLAIVASIVTAHHGDVSAHSTPGGGTTIRLQLPLVQPPQLTSH